MRLDDCKPVRSPGKLTHNPRRNYAGAGLVLGLDVATGESYGAVELRFTTHASRSPIAFHLTVDDARKLRGQLDEVIGRHRD